MHTNNTYVEHMIDCGSGTKDNIGPFVGSVLRNVQRLKVNLGTNLKCAWFDTILLIQNESSDPFGEKGKTDSYIIPNLWTKNYKKRFA